MSYTLGVWDGLDLGFFLKKNIEAIVFRVSMTLFSNTHDFNSVQFRDFPAFFDGELV
jgi:hypothetical protein